MQHSEGAGQVNSAAGPGQAIKELPLSIGGELVIRSISNPLYRTRSKVVGAVHGEYILIKEPVVVINERLTSAIEGDFMCSYFDSGWLYTFRTRCGQRVLKDVICVDYPGELEVKQIRKHRRIRVNIETEFMGPGSATPFPADMKDISHGGCCLGFQPMVAMIQGMYGLLTFSLPNEQMVRKLKCQIMSVKNFRSRDLTEAGVRFIGPASELDKISAFCEFCMFFELE
ncbi:MAG: PilZ domain-containing protein [Syntrophobacteraceae bacterium]